MGTTWGTTWFGSGRIDLDAAAAARSSSSSIWDGCTTAAPASRPRAWVYRADGTAIKSANPRNCWIPLIAADGTRSVEFDADGRFTVYIEAAANPFVEGPTPFSPTELGECATGKPDFPYLVSRMDVCALNEDVLAY